MSPRALLYGSYALVMATIVTLPAVGHAENHSLTTGDVVTALGFTPAQLGTAAGKARDAGAAIAAEQNTLQQANSAVAAANNAVPKDSNGKALASALVNRPVISPLTTAVGTLPTTIFNAQIFVGLSVRLAVYGVQIACTGDGTTPVIGSSPTISGPNQIIHWPAQPGGSVPSSTVVCLASATATITTEAE